MPTFKPKYFGGNLEDNFQKVVGKTVWEEHARISEVWVWSFEVLEQCFQTWVLRSWEDFQRYLDGSWGFMYCYLLIS